jgi:hypothetical protein
MRAMRIFEHEVVVVLCTIWGVLTVGLVLGVTAIAVFV